MSTTECRSRLEREARRPESVFRGALRPAVTPDMEAAMQVLYERCCGLDVHKRTVVACVIVPGEGGRPRKATRTFATMTDDLLLLADWLAGHGVSHVAMESTGVFWKPVWNLLEERFTLLLVNAHHVHAVPGRKTDAKDCEWLADLLRHGLLKASFVPDRDQRELRELTRYRTALLREPGTAANRIQKVLEGANVKLAAVATDILGVSARRMLRRLVEGDTDLDAIADLAQGKMRQKLPELRRALAGHLGPHQRFLLAEQLAHVDALDERIARLSAEVERRVEPVADALERLDAIPGIGRRAAEVVVAEVGTDMSRFPSAAHLASWAALCPGNNESGGKRLSGRTRKANPWLRAVLVEAAQAAGRTRGSVLRARHQRLAARVGAKRATVAVAHRLLVIVYHVLRDPAAAYRDVPARPPVEQTRERARRRLVRRLEALGYAVAVTAA